MDKKDRLSFRLEEIKLEGNPEKGIVKIIGGNKTDVEPREKSNVVPAEDVMSCEYKEDISRRLDYGSSDYY